MAEVTLSEYCDEAKELIRADSYDQAIAICRHIIKHYPKYVRAYRLMGEACLEKGDYVEAASLFKRVLGADMEDMVVRVGLGIIFDEQGALDEAIWQLERAFELGPGNAEIRAELQRLYADRDGTAPPKLKLTPAALGRLYLREELYQRAIDEFRGVLEEDPDRPDVQVALAQALWWSDQRQEAAEVCEAILERYPHCLKANLILGQILLGSDRESEARILLDIAQAMDPENVVAHALFKDRSSLSPQPVRVPRLDKAELAEELEELATATPGGRGHDRPEPEAPAVRPQEHLDEAMPDWLRRLREEEEEPEAEAAPASPEAHEMPDWLRQLAEEREADGAEATESEDRVVESTEGEIPAWLRDLGGATEEAAEAEFAPQEETSPMEDTAPTAEGPEAPAIEPAIWAVEMDQIHEAAEEPPSWLAELSEEAISEQAAPGSDEGEDGVPDWLRSLRAEAVSGPVGADEEIPAQPEGPTAEVSAERQEPEAAEWEEYHSAEAEPEISRGARDRLRETMPDESASIEEIMAWMERSKALLEEEGLPEPSLEEQKEAPVVRDESAEPMAEEEVPSWLAELRPKVEAAEESVPGGQIGESPEEAALPTPEEEMPTWLKELRPEGAALGDLALGEEEEILEEEIAWSQEEDLTIAAEAPEMAVSEAPASTLEGQELPSWLLELREEAMEEEPQAHLLEEAAQEEVALASEEAETAREALGHPAEEEMPSWLRELRAEEAQPLTQAEPAPHIIEAELPSWLKELKEEMAREGEIPPPEEIRISAEEELEQPVEEKGVPAWLGDLSAQAEMEEALAPGGAEISAERMPPPPLEEEEIPSWLRELRAQAAEGDTGVLMEKAEAAAGEVPLSPLEEEELPSWLRELRAEAAEEEISVAQEEALTPIEELPEAEPLAEEPEEAPEREYVAPAAPVAEAAAATVERELAEQAPGPGGSIDDYLAYLEARPRDHTTRLALARAYAEAGDLEQASQQYSTVLSYGSMVEELVQELEAVSDGAPDHLPIHELLADAYMRSGRLQKALDKYRWLRVMIAQ